MRVTNFTGREDELYRLSRALVPSKIVTLFGPGGIGKSALASEAVWRMAPGDKPPILFPDGIIYYSFYDQSNAEDALTHIAISLNEDPLLPSPSAAARRALGGKRILLILDGTEEADNLQAVLRVCDGCGVLITTRSPLDRQGLVIEISSLPIQHAVSLLQDVAGVWAEDEQVAGEVCWMLDGMPLALHIAGRAMAEAGEDADDYLSWLKQEFLPALITREGTHQRDSFPLLIKRSLSNLSNSALEIVKLMASMAYARSTAKL